MTLELRVMSGRRAGIRETFEKSVVSAGRHPLSDLRFDPEHDLDVSARHAELRGIDGVWTIHDQRSTNGTFVNGQRVEGERVLRQGDLITFGANGPRVEVHLPRPPLPVTAVIAPPPPAYAEPVTAPAPSSPRVDTAVRVAEAVKTQTRSQRQMFGAGLGALAALGLMALAMSQHNASAREVELLRLIARSESTSAVLERAVAQMQPRDSAFAAQLAQQAVASRRASEELRNARGAAAGGSLALSADRGAAVARMDFANVHDRNDAAVAMVASDLNGTFIAGTAFGITRDGLLVTNRHVLRDESGQPARRVRVIFANTTAWLPAHLVRLDDDDDLALIQIDAPGRYPVVAGVSRTGAHAPVGAPVASIGYPLAVDTPMEGSGVRVTARSTIAAGTVSKRLADVIQVDSYAGKGSSGSPLFDVESNVVGVIYGSAPESNGRIVYAVPAERLAAFLRGEAVGVLRN